MGWSGGTGIVVKMAEAIKANVKDTKSRRALYEVLVSAAESEDWDCQNEATGIDSILDKILGYD